MSEAGILLVHLLSGEARLVSLWERVPPWLCTGGQGAQGTYGFSHRLRTNSPVSSSIHSCAFKGTGISKFSLISGFEVSVPGYCPSQAFSSPSPLSVTICPSALEHQNVIDDPLSVISCPLLFALVGLRLLYPVSSLEWNLGRIYHLLLKALTLSFFHDFG